MKVTFKDEGHLYESFPARSWTSVTTLIERSAEEFNAQEQARRSSQNPKSKWFKLTPKKIVALWDRENKRATDTGSLYHARMEAAAYKKGSKVHRGKEIFVVPPIMDGSIKIARDQELQDGIYPEHLIYNEKLGVAGQSDLVFVSNGFVDIDDHKTNKVIEEVSYGYDYGNPRMMLAPVAHLMDCNYWHYALQLSIYMKLILLRNKHLKPGTLTLHHVDFEVSKRDQYGFPTIAMRDGFPIVKKKTRYIVPYLEKEAIAILKTLL